MVEDRERPQVVLVSKCRILDELGRTLLIRRSSNDRWSTSLWEFPGGKLDKGQLVFEALRREIMEEVGLEVGGINPMAHVHSELAVLERYKGLTYVLLIFTARDFTGEVKLSEEHDQFCWVKEAEMFSFDLTRETRRFLEYSAPQ